MIAGFLIGAIVAGVVALIVIGAQRRLIGALEAELADAKADRVLHAFQLLQARTEADGLRLRLGLKLPSRPSLADLRRTARSQESPCSSSRTSAG